MSKQTEILDQVTEVNSRGFDLQQIAKLGTGHTVRVRIHRDAGGMQSYAKVELLSQLLTWTDLTYFPNRRWLAEMPEPWKVSEAVVPETLHGVSSHLLDVALTILE